LTHAGTGWPDAVAGTFVLGGDGQAIDFRATVPAGKYRVWLIAGPIYRPAPASRKFLLRVNDHTLTDAEPMAREYLSEKHFHRFVDTFYSEKPDALWTNYIERMYPVRTFEFDTKGEVRIHAVNHFLSALVLVPASQEKSGWDQFVRDAAKLRREAFAKTLGPLPGKKPTKEPRDSVVFVPDALRPLQPRHTPTPAERERKAAVSVAAGHLAIIRVGITSFEDRECAVGLGAWSAGLDAKDAVVYALDWRFDGDQLHEAAMKPLQGKMLAAPRNLPLETG
jgi:hypothetical protein